MGYIHYTRLAREEQSDGSTRLVNISPREWVRQMKADQGLSGEERHYYTKDYCDGDNCPDCLVVEVEHDEYRAWNAAKTRHRRNYVEPFSACRMVSLDAPVPYCQDGLTFGDIIPDVRQDTQRDCEVDLFLEALRKDLEMWKPWAIDMLDCCQSGLYDSCEGILSEKRGVSTRQVRTYKAQFLSHVREFIKKWLDDSETQNDSL